MSEPTLDSIPNADRVRRLVTHYDPTKVKATENTLAKFVGKEKALLTTLIKKYGEEQPLTAEEKKKYGTGAAASSSNNSTPAAAGAGQNPKSLDDLPYADRVRRLIKNYDPTKMKATENTLAKFVGKEKALLTTLVKKHGPELPLTEEEMSKPIPSSPSTAATPTTTPPPASDGSTPATPAATAATKAPPPPPPKKPEKQITLEEMPIEDRIRRYVQKNEPDKVETIGQSLIEYKGKEAALLQSLKSKHGDEAPITEEEIEKIKNPPPKETAEDIEKKIKAMFEQEEKERKSKEEEEEKSCPTPPNPHQEAFDLVGRPPSPKPVSLPERIKRMAIHYDPKNLPAIESAIVKNKGKEQELLDALVKQYGAEPDYSRSIVPTDEDSLVLAPVPEDPPKSFGETYARVLRLIEVKDPDQLYNLPITLEAFRGREDTLLRALIQRYGEEPPQNTDYSIIENEELAARLAAGGFGDGTSGSRTSLSQSRSMGGLSRGNVTMDLSQKYKMNPPPPAPTYGAFARMTEGRLTQGTNRDGGASSSPAASPTTAGGASSSQQQQSSLFTPPPVSVPEQIFQPPVKDEEIEKSTTAKFRGLGRAADKPICEKLYYSPSVFKNLGKAVPPAPQARKTQADLAAAAAASRSADGSSNQESEEERKKRLEEQRKSRPPPPPARLLASDQRLFSGQTPIAKMSDVDHDLVTNIVISRVSKDLDVVIRDEVQTRGVLESQYGEFVENMTAKLEKGKQKALQRLTERMSCQIDTIHDRFAFKPDTLTYSPKEKNGNPNNMYYDEAGRIAREENGFEDDLFSSLDNSPVDRVNDSDILLSDRENFLLSVLPDERSRLKWKYNPGIDQRSPPSWQFRARLARYVRKYIPTALDDVDAVAADHVGREENLFAFLRAKYGPEPGSMDSEVYNHDAASHLFPTNAEVANAALAQQPVARSLEELDDFVFAPGDRPTTGKEFDEDRTNRKYTRNPNFVYSGIPPPQPPTLDDELRELRQNAYINSLTGESVAGGDGNSKNPWDPETTAQFHQILQNAENRKKLGLNDANDMSAEEEKNLDPRLREVRSIMQAIEASSNALVFEDPRWMGEENIPKHFWDIVEHREFDDDEDVLRGGVNLHERLNEAEKLGIPKEEFMKIEKERAERRRKERERSAKELHDAREKMRELEKLQHEAAEEARIAKQELELAKLEAEEKVQAANRRIEETRHQVQKELDALNERNRRMEEESVRRSRQTETGLDRQKELADELLKEKEFNIIEREKEVAQRLQEAEEREQERVRAEDERRKRERQEVEMWREKAINKMRPSKSDGVQTDPPPVVEKKNYVDSEIQMDHSPTGESGTQTRHDIVVIDDPSDLREIFEVKRQLGNDVPSLVDAIRQTSPDRNSYHSSNNNNTHEIGVGGGSPSPRRFNSTAESSTQGGDHPEMRTRDIQTPDFQAKIIQTKLKIAELEYQEQVARSKLQLLAYETSPRFLPRSAMSLQRESNNSNNRNYNNNNNGPSSPFSAALSPQYSGNSPRATTANPPPTTDGSSILNRLANSNNNNNNNSLAAPGNNNLNNSSMTSSRGSSNATNNNQRDAADQMKALNSTFTFASGKNDLPERSPEAMHQQRQNDNNNNTRSSPNPRVDNDSQQQMNSDSNNKLLQSQSSQQFIAPESATVEEYQYRVKVLYKKYAPEKNANAIDIILNRYSGEERTLLTSLGLKYGPEPKGDEATQLLKQVKKEEYDRWQAERQRKQQQQQQNQKPQLNQQQLMSPHQQQSIASSSVSPSPAASRNNFNYDNSSPLRNQLMQNHQNYFNNQQDMDQENNNGNSSSSSDLILDPVGDFQEFFQQWELAPAFLPQTNNSATPRLAACKLTPEDIFLFPSLEASAARRKVRKQILTMNQIEQQTNGRTLYNDNAINALQDVASRVFFFSQVMYWAPPRNPSWKYVAVTGREILIGDDENHVKHRICLIGSPSETVALSVILYRGRGAVDGDDSPCVLVIRTGTPPVSRVWTSDVDPSSTNQQQQDIMLFFPSGLQARKSAAAPAAASAGSRLSIQGRFAALRAQRLMCAIEFAIHSEGPVAAQTSRGSLVTSPVTSWILRENNISGNSQQQQALSGRPQGMDETAYLLEKAASDLCGVRFSANSISSAAGSFQQQQQQPSSSLRLPQQSAADIDNGTSNPLRPPSYLDKMPLAQAHYNKRMMNENGPNYPGGSSVGGDSTSRNQSPYKNNNDNNQQQQQSFTPQQHNEMQLSEDEARRLALVDQRSAMYAAEREARERQKRLGIIPGGSQSVTPNNNNNFSAPTPSRSNYNGGNANNNNNNPLDNSATGPPSKPVARWGEKTPAPTRSAVSSRPIDPHTQSILGKINSASKKGTTPDKTKMKWIQDSR